MAISGTWTLHYSWGCTGSYGQVPITFNNDGTFALSPYTGKWTQNEGKIILRFDAAPMAVYGGDVVNMAMVGISSTFAGLVGCWYALPSGGAVALSTQTPEKDAAGYELAQP